MTKRVLGEVFEEFMLRVALKLTFVCIGVLESSFCFTATVVLTKTLRRKLKEERDQQQRCFLVFSQICMAGAFLRS